MAGGHFILVSKVGWDEVDPDGSACHDCGDECYLKMFQGYYQVEGCKKEFVDAVLCDSCDAIRREGNNAGEEWKDSKYGDYS